MHEEKLLALRESAWHGRAAGLDISTDFDTMNPLASSTSLKVKGKKQLQRGELPPLDHSANNLARN